MGMFEELTGREDGDDMARTKAREIDETLIEEFVLRLKSTLTNADEFRIAFSELNSPAVLSGPEVVEIAHRLLGGLRAKSRKAALTSISQERLRLSHAKAKSETAARSKVW